MNWLINIPVWGEPYREKFLQQGLPSIIAALKGIGIDFRFLIHTDDIRGMALSLPGISTLRRIPSGVNSVTRLGNANRIAIEQAEVGEAILFVTADMVFSREVFAACEKRFAEGKTFIACPTIRTMEAVRPIVGDRADGLFDCAWCHRHQFVRDCTWGSGHAAMPPYVFFKDGDNVVMHAFDLHSLAIYKTKQMEYTGPTESEIITMFAPEETHIVSEPGEITLAESCASDMPYNRAAEKLTSRTLIAESKFYGLAMQQWQFRQQIVLRGQRNERAQSIANRILAGQPVEFREGVIRAVRSIPKPIRRLVPLGLRNRMAGMI